MPARAKPSWARQAKHTAVRQPAELSRPDAGGSDSDSGPEEEFRSSGAVARSTAGGDAKQSAARSRARGEADHRQRPTAETPEQRMLRRMEAGPSDDDAASDSFSDSEVLPDGGGGVGRTIPFDWAASQSDEDASDSDTYSSGRDGSPGAGMSSDDEGMADVPFEQLASRRAGSSGGGARPSSGLTRGRGGSGRGCGGGGMQGHRGKGAKPHRENKNRPAEASSRRPVSRLRDVLQAPKTVGKDPRFEDLSGTYHPDRFRKQYAFLYEQQLPAEKSDLKAAMKKVKSADKKEQLAAEAQRIEAQLREDAARQKKQQFEQGLQAKERAAVKAGKKPFFLKKSARQRAELVAKYEELKKAGRLEKFLEKRRRKNAAKDHRYIPRAGGRE